MTSFEIWTLILGLGVVTYLIRFSFLGLLAGREVPAGLRRALGFVPVTVLPALTLPMVLVEDGVMTAEPGRVIAATAGLAVGIATRHMIAALATAMLVFLALRALGL